MKVKEESEKAGLTLKKLRSWHLVHHFMANRWGNNGNSDRFYFLELQITQDSDYSHKIERHLLLGRKAMTNPDSILKSRDITNKGLSIQSYGFSSSHIWMWELDNKASWVLKNWCFWIVVLEKTLESPLNCKEIQPVHPKGNQSWIFIGRTDVEAETPIFWPPDSKNWLTGEDPDAEKDWGQEKKRLTEDEMIGWYHRLNGHDLGKLPNDWEAWCAGVHGVAKSQTQLSDWTELKTIGGMKYLD